MKCILRETHRPWGLTRCIVERMDKLQLCEGTCEFAEAIKVQEARSDYEVKLIAPGKGSTAFYTEEALKSSGPKAFRAGTHMYWNHPTRSEESERPERSLSDLAAVLTTGAKYREDGPKGPGLYARAKVFSDYADKIEERAGHIGLSIIADGLAEMKDGKPVMKSGLPVLKEFTVGYSTDFVTRAGAGGLILTEQAKEGDVAMNEAELKALREGLEAQQKETAALKTANAATQAENRKLRERMALSDAAGEVRKIFSGMSVTPAIQERVSGRILAGNIPLTEAGDLDAAKLKTMVEAEAKDECAYVEKLSGGRIVTGMGAAPTQLSEAELEQNQRDLDAEAEAFAAGLGLRTKEAQAIMTKGRQAFRPEFNASRDGRGTEVEE